VQASRSSPFLRYSTVGDRTGARRHWLIWAAVIPVALWALLRAAGLDDGNALATLLWFTPWAAIAAFFVTGIAVALRNWGAAVVAAVAAACLAVAVLPRALGTDTTSATGHETLTVLSANVYFGDADPDALVSLVDRYDPDLLSVQELTPAFARRLRRAGIRSRLPESVLMPMPRARGTGLYARRPLTPIPAPRQYLFRMPRATISMPDGRMLRVVAVHPQPPVKSFDGWREAFGSLPAPGGSLPWVLVGDFNATFDQGEFRDLVDSGYRDAGDATGQGLEPTWPGDEGLPVSLVTIDHILADDCLGVAEYGVDDLPGSDHRAIHAVLVLP
jgi:endonuclease/exonuclease/phosphatase (EEP) superfamily protein YafD